MAVREAISASNPSVVVTNPPPENKIVSITQTRLAALKDATTISPSERTRVMSNILMQERPMPLLMKTSFLEAVQQGEKEVVSQILDEFTTNLNDPKCEQETRSLLSSAFEAAVTHNQLEIVKILMAKFPAIFAFSEKKIVPSFLSYHLNNAAQKGHFGLVEFFVKIPGASFELEALVKAHGAAPQEIREKFPQGLRDNINQYVNRVVRQGSLMICGLGPNMISAISLYPLIPFMNLYLYAGLDSSVSIPLGLILMGKVLAVGLVVGLLAFTTCLMVQKVQTGLPFRELLDFKPVNPIVSNP